MRISFRLRVPAALAVRALLAAALVVGLASPATASASAAPAVAQAIPCVLVCRPPVPSDCSQDVAGAFNDWLATVPDGSVIDLAPGGCYLVNDTRTTPMGEGLIVFVNRHNLIIEGNGATIRTTRDMLPRHERALLYFELGGSFVVRDVTLQGRNFTPDCAIPSPVQSCYNSNLEGDAAVRVRAVNGLLFHRVHLKNTWGDGLEVDPGRFSAEWDGLMSRNVSFLNSTVDTTGRHAFSCSGCANFTIQGSSARNIGYHVVDVETEGPLMTGDVTLLGNTFSHFYLSVIAAKSTTGRGWGPFVARGNVTTELPATCAAPFNIGTYPANYGPVTIEDNNMISYQAGVQLSSVSQANVRRNTMAVAQGGGCGVGYGVGVNHTPSGSITGNTFVGAHAIASVVNSTVLVCGNRTTPRGAFDQPVRC